MIDDWITWKFDQFDEWSHNRARRRYVKQRALWLAGARHTEPISWGLTIGEMKKIDREVMEEFKR